MIAAAEPVTDAAVTVALITAALALVSTVVTAVVAVVNAILERVAAWQSYKRGLYKGLLELIASLPGASDADLNRLEREYRAQRLQARLAGRRRVEATLKGLTFNAAKGIHEDTEAFNELVKVFQSDISSLGRVS